MKDYEKTIEYLKDFLGELNFDDCHHEEKACVKLAIKCVEEQLRRHNQALAYCRKLKK